MLKTRQLFNGLFFGLIIVLSVDSQAQTTSFAQNVENLRAASQGQATIKQNHNSIYARSFRSDLPIAVGSGDAESRALDFLGRYVHAFGSPRPGMKFAPLWTVEQDQIGMSHVRFQQQIKGIPVTGSYISIHMKAEGVTSVMSSLLPDGDAIDTNPTVSVDAALSTAQQLIGKVRSKIADKVRYTKPRLEIFDLRVVDGGQSLTQSRLAWFIEAKGPAVRQYIWIDAQQDGVIHHFSQLTDARNRLTYDSQSTGNKRHVLRRNEASGPYGDTDIDQAHDFIGDSYDYFNAEHGRDSYNDLGSDLISNVDFCPPLSSCPYANAYWDGDEMTYGDGFTIDDVVAHELTHGVTEFTAGLLYQNQSGALNESFSDIFGEVVDLTNGALTDTPAVRWQAGEDLPGIGAIRNLMNPNAHGDPAKVTDPLYYCGTADHGGVHTNSGVPNHAFALMVDGGSYNGQTIAPLGLSKAGKIQYRALSIYLGTSSTLADNYTALNNSCSDLIGVAGITADNCTQVTKALDAVELDTLPCGMLPPVAELCPAGKVVDTLFNDGFETVTSGYWTNTVNSGLNHWTGCGAGTPDIYCSTDPNDGFYFLFGKNHSSVGGSVVTQTSGVLLPADARALFAHKINMETGYDGGVVEYTTNGGSTWTDAQTLFIAGQNYTHTLSTCCGNPLGGRMAFSGNPNSSYIETQLDLSSLTGQTFALRFRMGTDSSISDVGWKIDDVSIYQCIEDEDSTCVPIKTIGSKFIMLCL